MSLYNRVELTKRTLDNLFLFSGENFKLWLINDGSSDETSDYIGNLQPYGFCKSIEVKDYKESIGKAKRLNEFLKNINYDYCCIVDNDVLLPLNWLFNGISILKKYNQVGMVSVNVEGYHGPVKFHPVKGTEDFLLTTVIGGACLLFDQFVKKEIKILCEDYGRYGHEDAHITHQVRVKGKYVVCLPKFGIHLGEKDFYTDDWSKKYFEWKTKSFNDGLTVLMNNCSKLSK